MKIGKYQLGKTVGKGAFSKVKVAINTETGEEYVIKIIDKTGRGSKTGVVIEKEVKMEISLMKLLKHKNIVQMYEVMESSKHFYIVLESVRGGDLCDRIMENGKLTEEEAQHYVRHLIDGLLACHQNGVAHRDIKPENMLISKDNILKIGDFGLSRFHRGRGEIKGASDLSTDAVGTLSYAAPEVLGGHYDAFKADLWSIGVLLFVVLSGKFPFGCVGYTDEQIKADIRKAKINRFPKKISDGAKELLHGLIVLDPEKRLTLEKIQQHPWVLGKEGLLTDAANQEPQAAASPTIHIPIRTAMLDCANAIDQTTSPQWSESPVNNNPKQHFLPSLYSPACKSTSPSNTASQMRVPLGSRMTMDELKQLIEDDRRAQVGMCYLFCMVEGENNVN